MKHSLLDKANDAFVNNNPEIGLSLLRECTNHHSDDPEFWHRLAVVEEQIGDAARAGEAHFQCIQLAPNNPIALLYAGFWLQQHKILHASASAYSLAYDIDARCLEWWCMPNVNPQTQKRSQAACRLLPAFLKQHHLESVTDKTHARRISQAVWPRLKRLEQFHIESGQHETISAQKLFVPQLFYIPGIRQIPYYETEEFGWASLFTQFAPEIKAELFQYLSGEASENALRPYLSKEFNPPANLAQLAGSKKWSALDLYRDGVKNQSLVEYFPKTFAALENVPLYCEEDHPFEVFFSVLDAGQSIAEHYGQSNHSLTVHLALDIPEHCHLKVGGDKRHWHEGELIIFDDSFLHSAHNHSDQQRIVLIFSIWHPDLSITEQNMVKKCFASRRSWMNARSTRLKELTSSVV